MKIYKVSEVAELLKVNEDTVRRWIGSGDLIATRASKKKGFVINEQDLYEFVETKPKYRARVELSEFKISETYREKLNEALIELVKERARLNYQINIIQSLLDES